MMSASMRSTSSRRLIFGGFVIVLELTGMNLSSARCGLMRSIYAEAGMFWWTPKPEVVVYSYAESPDSVLSRGKCEWDRDTSFKSAVFSSSSSLSPLAGVGGGLVCEVIGKADLLSDYFHSTQYRESVHRYAILSPSSQSYHICIQIEWG